MGQNPTLRVRVEAGKVVQVLRTAPNFVAYRLLLLVGMAAWGLPEAISLLRSIASAQIPRSTPLTSKISDQALYTHHLVLI